MCRRYAKLGVVFVLLAVAGFAAGGILSVYGFVALWWEYPRSWQPLAGLSDAPEALLAIDVPNDTFLLQTSGGQLYTCQNQACAPVAADWSTEYQRCSAANRPNTVSLFPVLLSWDIRVALGCERDYLGYAETLYIVQDARRGVFQTGGPTFIPTDAALIGIALLGGLVGMLIAAGAGALVGLILYLRGRQAQSAGQSQAV